MKARQHLLFLFLLPILVYSCTKDTDKKYCWQLVDALGNNVSVLCDKSESEMQSLYPNACNYYKLGGEEYCWFVNGQDFVENKTESALMKSLECQGQVQPQVVKVPCDYCKDWYTRQKHTYKPTGQFRYTSIITQQFCGDTARTLYQGREIILRETADSLIIMQFSANGIF